MASKRRVRRRACTDKRAYDSLAHAQADARSVARSEPALDGLISAYRCQFGPHYHVGRSPVLVQGYLAAKRRAG